MLDLLTIFVIRPNMYTNDLSVRGIGEWLEQAYHQLELPQVTSVASPLICEHYGELLWPDWLRVLDRLNLGPHDHFIDLGSGNGKACVLACLLTPAATVVGYEYAPERCALAEKIVAMLTAAQIKIPLQFITGDFTRTWQGEGSVIYLCSTCFTQELLEHICNKIERSTSIRSVVSLRPLTTLRRLKYLGRLRVHCTWDSAYAYFYS